MHGTESSQHTMLEEITALRQQTQTLSAENAALRQRINDQDLSLTFLDAIIQSIPTPIFVKEAQELRFVRLNKAGEMLLGLSQEEIVGKTDYDFFPHQEATLFTGKDRYVLARGQLEDIAEEPIHTQPHGVRLLHTKKIPIYDPSGQPQYLLAISEDITERKGAEKSLQTYARRLQTLTYLNRLVSSSLHMEDVLQEMAHATGQLTDAPLVILAIADETAQTLEVVAFSDETLNAGCPIKTVQFGEGPYGWIALHRWPLQVPNVFEDDRFIGLDWWQQHQLQSYYGVPIVHQDTLIGVLSMMGRKPFHIGSMESTLLDSLMAQAIIAVEHARRFQAMQAQAEALSRANTALEHEIAERKHVEARLQQAQEELEDRVRERTADLEQANNRLQAEISERTLAETALRQRETQLQHLTAIGRIISASLNIQEVYQRFAEEVGQLLPFDRITLTNVDETQQLATVDYVWGIPVEGRNPGDAYPFSGTIAEEVVRSATGKLVLIDHDASIRQTFAGSVSLEQSGLHSHLVHPLLIHDHVIGLLYLGAAEPNAYDDQSLQLAESVSNQIAGAIANAQHYAERERLETQLQQAYKMEAIGTLAGGIAHDFNNLLAVIIGYTELLSLDLATDSQPSSYLQEILTACRRAKALVQQILTFSRQRDPERQPVPLHRVVNETLQLLRASLPTTIAFQCHVDPQSGAVMADPTQMHQVLMNLCTNAEHAMRQNGGLLEVRLEAIRVNAAFASHHPSLRPGPHVRLIVRDTGQGIPSEVQARIFDPFFTTKAVGEGTGMGLAVVHGIITNHDGAITVDSQPHQGTKFTIYLPQWQEAAREDIEPATQLTAGRGNILFVDDEAALIRAAHAMLAHLGYTVTAYTNSDEAFTCFQAAPHTFDLVITDQTMPNMTGEVLSQAVRQIRPDIPIILCTGFSHVMTQENALSMGINAFLHKPLTIHDLGDAIQRVLDEQDTSRTQPPV